MSSIQVLLQQFMERVNQKSFLRIVTQNWERRVGVVVKDRNQGFTLVFRNNQLEFRHWHDQADYDLLIRGDEQDIRLFFQGDELTYLHVKQKVETVGSIRDQLKLDSLIRLTSQQIS